MISVSWWWLHTPLSVHLAFSSSPCPVPWHDGRSALSAGSESSMHHTDRLIMLHILVVLCVKGEDWYKESGDKLFLFVSRERNGTGTPWSLVQVSNHKAMANGMLGLMTHAKSLTNPDRKMGGLDCARGQRWMNWERGKKQFGHNQMPVEVQWCWMQNRVSFPRFISNIIIDD